MALVLKKEEEDEDEDNRKYRIRTFDLAKNRIVSAWQEFIIVVNAGGTEGCTVGRRKRRVRSRRFHVVETTEAVQGGRNVSRVR